ncbi:MAG: COX15/CtaA family protein [Polyangiaceae bacterium]
MPRFARFAWGLCAYDVAVVAWGAFVRATGSGAGCGRHWPTCNGDIVPHAKSVETLIEVSHRLSSGTAFVLTAVLLVWALYAYPKGHRIRGSAAVAMALMAGEALIGAGLVLFELVAHDASMTRALSTSVHLVSTFLLLASMTLTAWWASGGQALDPRGQRAAGLALAVPLAGMLLVGASGAVTALGDTLFPSASVAAGLAQDFAPGAHLFVKLRAIHPMLAVATAAAIVVATSIVRALRPTHAVELASRAAAGLAIAQVCAGLLDVALRAPVWMQLVHLILADCVWIALVLTAATSLSVQGVLGEAAGTPRRQEEEEVGRRGAEDAKLRG